MSPEAFCAECGEQWVEKAGDLCPACVKEKSLGYRVRIKMGRLANGFELDHGHVSHAVPFGSYAALCGTKPGRRSVGWNTPYPRSVDNLQVTCPRCQAKIEKGKGKNEEK